jgi:UDP-glucuronate 4-epimerase
MTQTILVTGCAGFIGFHVTARLLDEGARVIGIDNLNSYYETSLKEDRLNILKKYNNFHFEKIDLGAKDEVLAAVEQTRPDCVINLAAQAGVRNSIDHPWDYLDSNVSGFLSVLEACRHNKVGHLIYASSSSVYGANSKIPFAVQDNVDRPVSLYAATKKMNELMSHSYSHLYGLPTTGLRFFTVYGPWGRPDMAYWKFTKAIFAGDPIDVYNHGKMKRDFTYIDDVADAICRLIAKPPHPVDEEAGDVPSLGSSCAPWTVLNVGNKEPVKLMDFIKVIEKCVGKKARIEMQAMQPGDVPATYADTQCIYSAIGFTPKTKIDSGIKQFVDWFRQYYIER